MVKQFRNWLGRLVARLARKLLGPAEPMPYAEPVPAGRDRFEVLRQSRGLKWSLYDGPSGAKARNRFLQVKSDSQHGITEFYHTQGGVRSMRDRYVSGKN